MLSLYWPDDRVIYVGRGVSGPVVDEGVVPDFVNNISDLAQVISGCSAVINLAGPTPGAGDMADHLPIARSVLCACDLACVPRCLLMSSQAIYGPLTGQVTENTVPKPVGDYGRGKLAMENAALHWPGDVEVSILRLANVAGADQLLGRRGSETPSVALDVFPNGTSPRRCYLGPQALAVILFALARYDGDLPDVLNLGAGSSVAMADLLNAGQIPWHGVSAPDTALPDLALDSTRLQEFLGLPGHLGSVEQVISEWQDWKGRSQ
jgi:nucleoside-diphosphate-sugar epimerase